jgi:acyl-CoA synthetase (AMP-forming)/AMP-acid ligase II
MLMIDFLEKGNRLYPERIVMDFHGQTQTYGELNSRVNRLANALIHRFGIQKGHRVAVLSRNHPAFVETYLACAKVGAVCVPLNYRLHPNDYLFLLNDSEARILVAECEFLDRLEGQKSRFAHLEHILSVGKGGMNPTYEDVLDDATETIPEVEVNEDDIWIQMYTSGTTGIPKGAMLTHRNLLNTAIGIALDVGFNIRPCRVLVVAPIFHIGGWITILSSIVVGASFNIKHEFYPPEVLKGMSEEGCTHSFMVPVMIRALLSIPDVGERDYSSLRQILYGAAPMDPQLLARAQEVFKCDFIQGYGLTESTGVLGLLMPEDHKVAPNATCREYCMAKLMVINERGEQVKPGEVGEIVAKGEGIMKGYWKMEKETKEAFVDGWLRTGDLATMDERGYITIVDRLKDMIIKGGENIYPSEIEKVILTHPAVQHVAVIGIPDEKWGEEIIALVVPKPGHDLTEKELSRFCRENLASFRRPKRFEIRKELPLTATGKVLKKVIREEFWQGMEKRVH